MNILCPYHQPCLDDANSLGNYSSEAPDQELFRSIYFPNQVWDDDFDIWNACYGLCVSTISQADADLCAQNNAKICERDKVFGNIEHTCYRTCSDGQQYSFTVPAGIFYDLDQAQANALAIEWCNDYLDALCAYIDDPGTNPPPVVRFPPPKGKRDCNDRLTVDTVCVDGMRGVTEPACFIWGSSKEAANQRARELLEAYITNNVGCLIEFPRSLCIYEDVDRWIVPHKVGAFVAPLTWTVFGSVPAGLTFTPSGVAMHITGQATAAGTYYFRLTLEGAGGLVYTYRNYVLEVMEITEPPNLPAGTQDQNYSHTITVDHGWAPLTFSIKPGDALPLGLTLDSTTGTISGRPDGFGTATFTILVSDKYGAVCEREFTLLINPNIFASMAWVTSTTPTGLAICTATGVGESVYLDVILPADPVTGSNGVSRCQSAFLVWNANNTTGAPLSCRIRLNCTITGLVIYMLPHSATFSYSGPNPPYVVMSEPAPTAGIHQNFFTIPIGISQWVGVFNLGCVQWDPAQPPYTYARMTWDIQFDIL